jgi:hypothetical protein
MVMYLVLDRTQGKGGSSTPHSLLFTAIAGSQLVGVTQLMGILSNLTIEWDEPFVTLLGIAKLFTFNIDVLRPTCVATMSPIVKYVITVLIVAAALSSCAWSLP